VYIGGVYAATESALIDAGELSARRYSRLISCFSRAAFALAWHILCLVIIGCHVRLSNYELMRERRFIGASMRVDIYERSQICRLICSSDPLAVKTLEYTTRFGLDRPDRIRAAIN